MIRDAVISEDGVYRYRLTRCWGTGRRSALLWVMLNPSTADDLIDDPTIRRCIAYSTDWGFEALEVVNLYAYRATEPRGLGSAHDPIGPNNDRFITDAASTAEACVVAWGQTRPMGGSFTGGFHDARVRRVLRMIGDNAMCLGTTADGAPRHPGRVAARQHLVPFGR
jgi:hypothetical protein